MYSLMAVIVMGIAGLLMYKKRFTSEKRIGGLYSVQLYYLLISILIPGLLLNISADVLTRPEISRIEISSSILFLLYTMAIMCAAIGTGIHSTSTSVYLSFIKQKRTKLEAFRINEQFHGYLSHQLLFMGAIFGGLFLGLLELNHPYQGILFNRYFLIGTGLILGLIQSITVVWSTYTINWTLYIGSSLLSSLVSATLILFFFNPLSSDYQQFPLTLALLVSFLTISTALIAFSVIFILSDKMTKRFIRRIFPKSHDFYKSPAIKFLKYKIERDWFE